MKDCWFKKIGALMFGLLGLIGISLIGMWFIYAEILY